MSVRSVRIILEASNEGAQNYCVYSKQLVSLVLPPSLKAWAVWQAKAFEKFTAESPCERFQCFGIQEGEVSGSKGGYAGDVKINRLEAKENGFVVSTQA